MAWRRLFSQKALESAGGSVAVKVDDKVVFVAAVGDRIYALEGACTYARCVLGALDRERLTVRCFCHGALFDLKTGAMLEPPTVSPNAPKEKMGLKTFEARLNGGWVEVDI